jgi:hypothetical protein
MLDGARLQLEQSALDADIALAQTTIAEREAERGRAERDLDLLRRASAAGGTNPRELADAESALAIATARKTQALAAIEVLNEAKKLLAKRVSDLTITAPFEGVVTARHVDLGAWAAMGGSIVDIADTVHLEAWFDVPQELYEFVHSSLADRANASGASTTASSVTLQSVFGRTLTPTSIRIVPEIDPKARTFHAIAAIDNTDGALAAGLAVEARSHHRSQGCSCLLGAIRHRLRRSRWHCKRVRSGRSLSARRSRRGLGAVCAQTRRCSCCDRRK